MPELKNKQRERFCLEYASGSNGTQAAIAAGYSEKTAGSKVNQLLEIIEVKKRLCCARRYFIMYKVDSS